MSTPTTAARAAGLEPRTLHPRSTADRAALASGRVRQRTFEHQARAGPLRRSEVVFTDTEIGALRAAGSRYP